MQLCIPTKCKDVPWLPSFHWLGLVIGLGVGHGRRINTEEMAKFVAAVWGTEFIQFLAAHAILHQDEWKNRMNGTRMIWKGGWIHPILKNRLSAKQLAPQGIEYIIYPEQQRRPLPFLLFLSFFYMVSDNRGQNPNEQNWESGIPCCLSFMFLQIEVGKFFPCLSPRGRNCTEYLQKVEIPAWKKIEAMGNLKIFQQN